MRHGTSYNLGNLVGTAYIPAASNVALNIPVDATVGTAILTSQNARDAMALALTGGVTPATNSVDDVMLKAKAAFYDSASVSGNVITLSNGHTQTVTPTGRVLT